jgi:type I restriction enzyme R subunit
MTLINEADTCRDYVVPRLTEAGWYKDPHAVVEQQSFTDGRIVAKGIVVGRLPTKRPDYLLRLTRDFTIAVVEAKRAHKLPADGLQQAKDYAELLGLKFAFATNGEGIVEYDYFTGVETELTVFPTPGEMLKRYLSGRGLTDAASQRVLAPSNNLGKKPARYYQEIAINRVLEAITSTSTTTMPFVPTYSRGMPRR